MRQNKTRRDIAEDVSIYYNEGPYGPNGEDKSLWKFFHTRWSPGGGGSAFDSECKEALLDIRDTIVEQDKNIMRFMGVSETDPTKGGDLVVDGKPYEPRENEVIRFRTKEFVYRNSEWKEMGDEEAPSWNSDKEN